MSAPKQPPCHDAPAFYRIERKHLSIPDKWQLAGEFVAGSPWRDGRPVNDETMREEVKGYRKTWSRYAARVRCPSGEILSDNLAAGGGTDEEIRILPRSLPPVAIHPCHDCGRPSTGELLMNTTCVGDFQYLCAACREDNDPDGVMEPPCPRCHGSGKELEGWDCESCDGSGTFDY